MNIREEILISCIRRSHPHGHEIDDDAFRQIEGFNAALEAMEEYAQQSQPSGMRWVSASERMPDNSNPVYIRYKHADGYAKTLGRYCNKVWEWCDTEIEAIYPEFVLTIEWLDESSPVVSSGEGMAEVLRGIAHQLESDVQEEKYVVDNAGLYDPNDVLRASVIYHCTMNVVNKLLASLSPAGDGGSGWVRVEDGIFPPNTEHQIYSDTVAVYDEVNGAIGKGFYDQRDGVWHGDLDLPTHWQPLPAPPGE